MEWVTVAWVGEPGVLEKLGDCGALLGICDEDGGDEVVGLGGERLATVL